MAMLGLVVVVLVVVPLALVTVLVLVVLATTARPDATLASEVAAARRHFLGTSVASVVVMLVVLLAGVAVAALGLLAAPARVVGCAPLLAAALALAVLWAGETSWRRPTGATRTAVLHDRSARSLLTRGWSRAAALATAALAATIGAAGVVSDRHGDSITHVHGRVANTAGPFPGWAYGGPQLAVLVVCVALTAATVTGAARRSAVVTADVATDRLLRRASAARALRLLTTGVLLTVGPDLVAAGSAGANAYPGGAAHIVAVVAWVGGGLVLLAGIGTPLFPVPRLPAAPARQAVAA